MENGVRRGRSFMDGEGDPAMAHGENWLIIDKRKFGSVFSFAMGASVAAFLAITMAADIHLRAVCDPGPELDRARGVVGCLSLFLPTILFIVAAYWFVEPIVGRYRIFRAWLLYTDNWLTRIIVSSASGFLLVAIPFVLCFLVFGVRFSDLLGRFV